MSVNALIASTICFLIFSLSEAADCTTPHQRASLINESRGPDDGPFITFGPQTGKTFLEAGVGRHNITNYFMIKHQPGKLSEVRLTRTLNLDFVTDAQRLLSGAVIVVINLTCECRDCNATKAKNITSLHLFLVSPVDNYPPEFGTTPLNVREDTPVGGIVGNIRALVIDRDFPNFHWLTRFSLDPDLTNQIDGYRVFQLKANGDITLSKALDYEAGNRTYQLKMSATNSIGQTAKGNITVNVINVDDNPVRFVYRNCTSNCTYELTSSEPYQDPEIRAVDGDNDPIEYSIVAVLPASETGIMAINKTTGKIRQIQNLHNPHLRSLTLVIKAQAKPSIPAAMDIIDVDFAIVTVNFDLKRMMVSGCDHVLVGDAHVPVCLIIIYGISKHVI